MFPWLKAFSARSQKGAPFRGWQLRDGGDSTEHGGRGGIKAACRLTGTTAETLNWAGPEFSAIRVTQFVDQFHLHSGRKKKKKKHITRDESPVHFTTTGLWQIQRLAVFKQYSCTSHYSSPTHTRTHASATGMTHTHLSAWSDRSSRGRKRKMKKNVNTFEFVFLLRVCSMIVFH